MADAATIRQNVKDALERLIAGGETELAERLIREDGGGDDDHAPRAEQVDRVVIIGPNGSSETTALRAT